jgi:hypothetical protein
MCMFMLVVVPDLIAIVTVTEWAVTTQLLAVMVAGSNYEVIRGNKRLHWRRLHPGRGC